MKRHFWVRIMALILPIFLLTGCWQEEPLEEGLFPSDALGQSGTISRVMLPKQFSLPYAPELTLDPITCSDGMQQVVASLMCEGLFRLGPDLEPELWLCESYTYDAASFTYVFTLRSGVSFSDGTPLTGSHVKASLDRAKNSQRYGERLSKVAKITAEDTSVTITLSAANSGFPALLDIPVCKMDNEEIPIGTGPYLFSMEQSGAWLVSNQSWWRGGEQPVDRIALVEADDQDTMFYRFTSHDVQLVTADLTGNISSSTTGNISYLNVDTTILHYIGCNTRNDPLDRADFRQMLGANINRAQIVSALLSGHGLASLFPVSPMSPLYPEKLDENTGNTVEYDAKRPLTLLVNAENSFKVSVAKQIAEDFTAAGIEVVVSVLPWAEYTAALLDGRFDLYYGEVKLTADWDLSALLGTNGALNYGGWSNSQTDQLLADYAAAEDHTAAMERLCAHIQRQAPILPVCFKSTSVLIQSNVLEGLIPTSTEPFYNLTDCVIHLRDA